MAVVEPWSVRHLALGGAVALVQTEKGRHTFTDRLTTQFTRAALEGLQFGVREEAVFTDAHQNGSFAFSGSVVVVNPFRCDE